jgi:hypothetical protein
MKETENKKIENFLSNLKLGQQQSYKNMTILPLFFNQPPQTPYLTMEEALYMDSIEIFEKNQGGSVPELRVINKGNDRVLLIDSEELSGAKQNRILNTSILLKKKSDTIIPVSCTESGRWNYTSDKFSDSGNMAMPKMRRKKAESVCYSLEFSNNYIADQQQVWDGVEELFDMVDMDSPTRSMKEVYDRKKADVQDYLEAFRVVDNQQGFVVMSNGKIVGMEFLSSHAAFKKLYKKILSSYVIEAQLKQLENYDLPQQDSFRDFMGKLKDSETARFKSPGHGYDHRISGNELVGNMLVYRDEIIHLAAFNHNAENRKNSRFSQ